MYAESNLRTDVLLPEALTAVLPLPVTDAVRRTGVPCVEELRLFRNRRASVTADGRNHQTDLILGEREMNEILYRMCKGSLYAYQDSINQGYLAMPCGIRVGVCGSAATEDGQVIGVSDVTGLVIRIPHRHKVNVRPLTDFLRHTLPLLGMLIYAPPGIGKTTLLRALSESLSKGAHGLRTVVVDTREELHYTLDGEDLNLNLLVGYPRARGIEIATRSLGAELIVCDEIGSADDARAILSAANCGVPFIATAHACRLSELLRRPFIQQLHRAEIFGGYVGLCRTNGEFSYQITPLQTAEALCAEEEQ